MCRVLTFVVLRYLNKKRSLREKPEAIVLLCGLRGGSFVCVQGVHDAEIDTSW